MAGYQKIEYRIGKDGKVVETVLNGSGPTCADLTLEIEHAIGTVESQKRLPEYDEGNELLILEEAQTLHQGEV